MRKKSLLLILLSLVLALPSVFPAFAEDAADIRGYSKNGGYEYILFGSYPTDADGTRQPILWRVLRSSQGEAYVLSEYILFGAPVHGDYEHYRGWENSDLYVYLNETFINDAFTGEEQQALLVRTEDNAHVTLITSDEMKDASIGFSSNTARLCESTAWAKILPDPPIFELPASNNKGRWKPLYIYSKGKKYSPWWSRTRSEDYQHEQRRVMDEGKIGRISTGNSDLGVRPAITLNLNMLSIVGGNGTFSSPYQLQMTSVAPIATEAPAVEDTVTAVPQTEAPVTVPVSTPAPVVATQAPENQEIVALPTVDPALIAQLLGGAEETQQPAETEEIASVEIPTEAPTLPPTPIPTQAPTPEPTPEPTPDPKKGFIDAANPDTIHEKFPPLTQEGFLPEGQSEFVFADEDAGLWLYASQTLRIEINRYTGTNAEKKPVRWYEAQIFSSDPSEIFDLIPHDASTYTKYSERNWEMPETIARANHAVFALNSDFFIYRVARTHDPDGATVPIGIEIRDGEVFFEKPKNPKSKVYPPLDVMAFYPDGSIQLFENSTMTSKEILATGATDTLSFGPILVQDGEVSERSRSFGETFQPRTAFGMVNPGHYIAIVVEGRRSGVTEGQSCLWLADRMAELGATQAMNLDGGATSVMIFMGEQINRTGNYNSSTNRKQNEILAIGHSDAVR